MPSQLPLAEGRHNHPPRCCCISINDEDFSTYRTDRCPLCPEHGELVPGVECPQCHQPAGRPHTDFCTLEPGKVWDGVLPHPTGPKPENPYCMRCGKHLGKPFHETNEHDDAHPACAYPHLNHGDGRGCETDDCPKHGGR